MSHLVSKGLMIATAALAFLPLQAGGQGSGVDLASPPGKVTKRCGWLPFDGKIVQSPALAGSPTYAIQGGPYGIDGVVEGFVIRRPPTSRKLVFSLDLQGSKAGEKYAIYVIADKMRPKAERKVTDFSAMWDLTGNLVPGKWTHLHYVLSLPEGSTHVQFTIHNPNTETMFMGVPHVVVGAPYPADSAAVLRAKQFIAEGSAAPKPQPAAQGMLPFTEAADRVAADPGPVVAHILLRAPLCTKMAGESGELTFPVPAFGGGQVPLAFRMTCQSPGKLISYKWRRRDDKRNYVCDVKVQPGTKGVWLQYEALVLLGGPGARDVTAPTASEWCAATACVQCDSPEIQAIARKLSTPGDTEQAYAHKVFEFVRSNTGQGANWRSLDALAAVHSGGSCTNIANLVAALMRARGYAARTVAHMPTWSKDPLYEHWLAEYWQPGQGWIAVDSALGRFEPDRRTRVVLAVSSPKDENLAFEPLHERFVMPGAPYLSVLELSSVLFPADLTESDGINSVDQVACYPIDRAAEARLFEAASVSFRREFPLLAAGAENAGRYRQVFAAAKTGNAEKLLAAIEK